MKILVTGATGFLGKSVVRRLRQDGDEVRAFVRSIRRIEVQKEPGVEPFIGDLRDPKSLAAAVDGVDAVVHCAARVKTKGSWADFHADTVRGTEQLLEAVHKAGTPRFVHVSSIGIYRANEGDTINESTPFDDGEDDRGFYTQAKIQAEEAVWRAYRERQLPVIVIRPGLLYGPGRSPMLARLRVPARLFTLAIARRRQLLPLAYVDNVADGISLALHTDQSVVGRAYNVIDGEVPQDEYVAALRQARLWPKRTIFLPPAAFYPVVLGVELAFGCLRRTPPFSRHRFSRALASARYETSRARMELGWTSKVPLAEGLARVRAARV